MQADIGACMFGIIDCNRFYASAEQLFRPELRHKPVICLSNNDGAIVSLSPEASALGIPKFVPYFKVEQLVRKHNVAVFSSNYTLYGDISNRVMQTVQRFASEVEIYSIDEIFIEPVSLWGDLKTYGQLIRRTVAKEVGIGVGVGFGPTKTLAKASNRCAKKLPSLNGVCALETEVQREWLLKRIEVGDVWGIGSRLAKRLQAIGVHTAWDLSKTPAKRIRQHFNVCVERTVEELNGVSCLDLESMPPAKQQIFCTRSFGERLTNLEPIQQAIAHHASTAAEKLRKAGMHTQHIQVFLQTSPFKPNFYYESATIALPYPTDDTCAIARYATHAVKGLFVEGMEFSKTGIGLLNLIPKGVAQHDLFAEPIARTNENLMKVFDCINAKYGRGTVKVAAAKTEKGWQAKSQTVSPRYTTCWSELPRVKCV